MMPGNFWTDPVVLAATAAAAPLAFALRAPFFTLPLHVDTGFYVSNHTVARRRFSYARGWNARFAGASKVVPEAFYSLVYLRHGGRGYAFWSRFYYALVAAATAAAVGLLTAGLAGGTPAAYAAGLGAALLLSSEPQYGTYFESGEQFEALPQALGLWAIAQGVAADDSVWVASGALLWVLESAFVKLASFPAAFLVSAAGAAAMPAALPALAVAWGGGLAAYGAWYLLIAEDPLGRVRALFRHEDYLTAQAGLRGRLRRLGRKVSLAGGILAASPVIPAGALLGAVAGGPGATWACLWLAAGAVTYAGQAGHVWYYTLSLQGGMACLAGLAVAGLLAVPAGPALVAAGGLLWGVRHMRVSYGLDPEARNLRAWRPHGEQMARKNWVLRHHVPKLRHWIRGRSVLVYGAWNQAYVLLESSYEIPTVSPTAWLDAMCPGWRESLNRRLAADPPDFILDTDGCLDEPRLREETGVAYEPVYAFGGTFRLFERRGRAGLREASPPASAFPSPAMAAV